MTDKLICPFCGEPLEIDNDSDMAVCMTHCCDGGYWKEIDIWKQIIAWKQSATVLQKKLDKAMAVLQNIADGPVLMDVDIFARQMIKEIEDIKD